MGRWPGEPAYRPHRPPYLSKADSLPQKPAVDGYSELPSASPEHPVTLLLAGRPLSIDPGNEVTLFNRQFDDIEEYLALHRFAWLPLQGEDMEPAWVGALWKAWQEAHGEYDTGWSWHPYTASERLVNILSHSRRHGLPGPLADTLKVLGRHGQTIFEKLEYFGEHFTGNHLANNGRGLFLGGLALGINEWADVGGKILLEEAKRIFLPSGILREGSSHYHLLLSRSYAECWLAARAAKRPETDALGTITGKALSVIPALSLPGGFPLIGDISPDCPPGYLSGLINTDAGDGWISLLSSEDKRALLGLVNDFEPGDPHCDGWLRADVHNWAALWYSDPAGWSCMPGHGHQDCGSFEVHFDGEALFIDPGRGAYGETGEAARYREASVHNTLMIDDFDPYPANRPYYNDTFRRAVGGPHPLLEHHDNTITLRHSGYRRLHGGGDILRTWTFNSCGLDILDRIEGRGRHQITRKLVTTRPVSVENDGVLIKGSRHSFKVSGDVQPSISTFQAWQAYGVGSAATSIRFDTKAPLTWNGHINVTVI